MGLLLAESRLISLFIESILYGFYFITYAYTVQVLLFSSNRLKRFSDVNRPVFLGTAGLFFLISGNIALSFYGSIRAFIWSQSPGGAELEYSDVSGWLNIVETAFILFGNAISDWILLHRCWIFWNRMWRWICIPSLLWIGCIFCAIRIIVLEASFDDKGIFNSELFLPYGSTFWGASILINISTTVLTVLRMWLVEEANKQSGLQSIESDEFPKSTMHFIICLTVETGLLNTISAIATCATYAAQTNTVYIMSSIKLSVAGIACNLIILRANRRTKRLLKIKMKQSIEDAVTDIIHLSVPETVPFTMYSTEGNTESRENHAAIVGSGSISAAANPSQVRSRIEELPYP